SGLPFPLQPVRILRYPSLTDPSGKVVASRNARHQTRKLLPPLNMPSAVRGEQRQRLIEIGRANPISRRALSQFPVDLQEFCFLQCVKSKGRWGWVPPGREVRALPGRHHSQRLGDVPFREQSLHVDPSLLDGLCQRENGNPHHERSDRQNYKRSARGGSLQLDLPPAS